jgi:hypothetical protein
VPVAHRGSQCAGGAEFGRRGVVSCRYAPIDNPNLHVHLFFEANWGSPLRIAESRGPREPTRFPYKRGFGPARGVRPASLQAGFDSPEGFDPPPYKRCSTHREFRPASLQAMFDPQGVPTHLPTSAVRPIAAQRTQARIVRDIEISSAREQGAIGCRRPVNAPLRGGERFPAGIVDHRSNQGFVRWTLWSGRVCSWGVMCPPMSLAYDAERSGRQPLTGKVPVPAGRFARPGRSMAGPNTITASQARAARQREARRDEQAVAAWLRELSGRPR